MLEEIPGKAVSRNELIGVRTEECKPWIAPLSRPLRGTEPGNYDIYVNKMQVIAKANV